MIRAVTRANKLCKGDVIFGALRARGVSARGRPSPQFARLPNSRDRTRHDQRLQTLDEIEFGCRLFARPDCIVHGSIEHEAQEDDAGR